LLLAGGRRRRKKEMKREEEEELDRLLNRRKWKERWRKGRRVGGGKAKDGCDPLSERPNALHLAFRKLQ